MITTWSPTRSGRTVFIFSRLCPSRHSGLVVLNPRYSSIGKWLRGTAAVNNCVTVSRKPSLIHPETSTESPFLKPVEGRTTRDLATVSGAKVIGSVAASVPSALATVMT